MGKKNKRPGSGTDPSTSAKRIKTSGPSSPPPSLSFPKIKYEDMPASYKKKFYLHDDCGSLRRYIQLLSWLRTLSSMNGSTFEDIGNLNCSEGYPLMEVEVVAPSENSAKFLIHRENLYLIAFTVEDKWCQFACEFEIEGFEMLTNYDGTYRTQPWKHLGPMCMIDAIDVLSDPDRPLDIHLKACEVFFVHLSEAARLYPIESLVCKSLSPSNGGNNVNSKRPFKDEELPISHIGTGDESDVLSLVREEDIEDLIKNYRSLSKTWYVYALTGKRLFPITPKNASRFHVKSKKSLRYTIAVLCNINLEKVLGEWRKKSSSDVIVTPEVYEEMERKVNELQAEKKVFVAKKRG